MVYIFYGLENFLIQKEINKIILEQQLEEIDISRYDLDMVPIEDILEDAETISLFSTKKMIIVEHASIFTGSTKKGSIIQNVEKLETYFHHINEDVHLIFLVNQEKLDERKKIVKLAHKVGVCKSFEPNKNPSMIVKELFGDYTIEKDTINLLITRVGTDLNQLNQEINKLKMYAYDTKKITEEDVCSFTTKTIDMDIFHLIENIVTNKKSSAIETYHEMLKQNEEPIKIIVMLANQFRLIYQAKQLYQKGYTEKDIASTLNIHPYRIKLALQKGSGFKIEQLQSYLEKLANLDIHIKTGKIEKELGLELFILEV